MSLEPLQKTILVTGGAGYIGSHVSHLLVEQGYRIVVVDSLEKGRKEFLPPQATFYHIDLSDSKALKDVFEKEDISCVMHFAGYSEVAESTRLPEKYFAGNVANTLILLDTMRAAGVQRFIFSSSAAVYGVPSKVPIEEDHPKRPMNPYGVSKSMVEEILQSYHDAHGMRFVSLRYFNAAGADESGVRGEAHEPETHLIPLILDAAMGRREAITIFGDDYETKDGTCIRDYVHVNDIAHAHVLAMKAIDQLKQSCINLGTASGMSVKEIISMCEEVTGVAIPTAMGARRAGDPPILVADFKRAQVLLGWTPQRDIRQIVQSAWEWHKKLK